MRRKEVYTYALGNLHVGKRGVLQKVTQNNQYIQE